MNRSLNFMIELNNEGVACLEGGNFADAVAVLSGAISEVRKLLISTEDERYTEDARAPPPISALSRPPPSADPKPEIEEIRIGASRRPRLHEQEVVASDSLAADNSIFQNAYIINPTHHLISNEAKVRLYTLTCMFNLSLSHHLWSFTDSDNQFGKVKRLGTAIRLYELAYNLMTESEDNDLCHHGVLALAIFNNLSHAHATMGDESKVALCKQHLLSIVMYYHECGGINTRELSAPILSTVVRFLLKDPRTSAAA
jgi:hypothetical protein